MGPDLLELEHLQGEKLVGCLVSEYGLTEDMAKFVVRKQLTLEGTYTLHSKTAAKNGGDYDFDWVCVIDSKRFPRFVESRFRMATEYVVKKNKADRAKSLWQSIESVALSSRGNQIGVITDLMSSCIAAGRHDLHSELVPELQLEIDSLKFNTHADRKKLQAIREQVPPAPWLALKDAKAINDKEMPRSLEVLPTDLIGKLYNILRKHVEELIEKPAPLHQFRGLIVGNKATEVMFKEAHVINNVYRVGHSLIQASLNEKKKAHERAAQHFAEAVQSGNRESITEARKALGKAKARLRNAQEQAREQASSLASIVSSWGDGKAEDRHGWCQALHTVVSRGQGVGTGSILFHAYPQEVVDSIALPHQRDPNASSAPK